MYEGWAKNSGLFTASFSEYREIILELIPRTTSCYAPTGRRLMFFYSANHGRSETAEISYIEIYIHSLQMRLKMFS
jgi:hypothetical protein